MVSWMLSLALYASMDAPDLKRTLESILKMLNHARFHNRLLKCYTSKSAGDVFDTGFLFPFFCFHPPEPSLLGQVRRRLISENWELLYWYD
jgi:hypothetical protein